ncbi:MAG: putative sulfate exporter family transporter [Saprospiraceae bacterium]
MSKTNLLKREDYWAIWIGLFLLFFGLIVFFLNPPEKMDTIHKELSAQLALEEAKAPFQTMGWYKIFDQQQKIKGSSEPIGKFLLQLTNKPAGWKNNPLESFLMTANQAKAKQEKIAQQYQTALTAEETNKAAAIQAEQLAAESQYQDAAKNLAAETAIKSWRESLDTLKATKKKYDTKAFNLLPWLLVLAVVLGLLFATASWFMEISFWRFLGGFSFVFLIGTLSYFLGGQATMKTIGFGYAAWAIVIGLLISNTVGTPEWVKPALTTELYIKTGLVLLGAEILLGKILAIGLPGIFVAWVVTPIVLVSTFWFGQKILKISSKSLNITISADMSVCGVSAAVATAAASKASKEELTIAVGLSMIFTSVMMIVMPAVINALGLPEVLGGAWIGGTIDATGAVVAAGAFLGEKALNVAATIKMIQNMLIGVIAFGVAIYFATKEENNGETNIGWGEIWRRFPKFILGFMGASVLFSIIYAGIGPDKAYALIDQGVIGGFTKHIRDWLFCLAFVSIGLSINFKALKGHFTGGKPLILYLVGQSFNLALTLLMAYIMFYLVFPGVTAQI